ncbi:MAG: Xaa-Pro dipeptidase [Flavobacterium sp.]|jgi:Xaa-Pro dipeptidase
MQSLMTKARSAPKRGFHPDEYQRRVEQAQTQMVGEKLGAILITTEADMYYFTGFLSQFWQSPTRPWFAIIPSHGKPIAVIPEIGANCMRNNYMEDIRTWASPHANDDGVSLLDDTLFEVVTHSISRQGSEYANIGVNQGRETHLRMPLKDFEQLRFDLSQRHRPIRFKDATNIIRGLRMVKSEAEIEKLWYVAQCASDVFENLHAFVCLGMRDDEIFRQFKIECLKAGVDDVSYLVGAAGQGGYDDIIAPPAGRHLKDGDVLILDTGCTFDGYFCDFDRNYGFGTVDDESKRAYEVVWRATEAGLAAAVPGNTCQDVFLAMNSIMQAGGALGESVGRYGHGLGIQLTEPPSHTHWDKTIIETGMVLTLEPGMIFAKNRMMVHEENIVVRESGPELLSRRAAPELPVF